MSDNWSDHKVPVYVIRMLSNQDSEFYPIVGPWLSQRHITAELGSPVWDDGGKLWWVAVSEGKAIGAIGLHKRTVCSFYVSPGVRGMLIGYALLRALLTATPGPLKAVATNDSLELFTSSKFSITGTRGRFTLLERMI